MAGLAEHLGVEEEPEPAEPEYKDGEEEDGGDPALQMAETLIEAVNDSDKEAVAHVLKAFFKHMETEPHTEAPHESSPMHGLLGLSSPKE